MKVQPILIPGSPIFLIGEAPGKDEEAEGTPFVGASGQELTSMLEAAGIERNSCSISNVFHERPPSNDLTAWMGTKKEGGVGIPVAKGKYFFPQYYLQRERLFAEIASVKPNLIIAFGNTAAWALLDKTGIIAIRGAVAWSRNTETKVLPTIHPAAVMREWGYRPTVIMDLIKASREASFPELKMPKWRIIVEPTLLEIYNSIEYLWSDKELLSYDIETYAGQITCIGFAIGRVSFTIPFSKEGGNKSYWQSPEIEKEVWKMVKTILESPCPKVTQNGLYDIQYLLKYKIKPRNSIHDTMLFHHSLQPEMPKGLGFLGSVYTDFPSWKDMRPKGDKKDE